MDSNRRFPVPLEVHDTYALPIELPKHARLYHGTNVVCKHCGRGHVTLRKYDDYYLCSNCYKELISCPSEE